MLPSGPGAGSRANLGVGTFHSESRPLTPACPSVLARRAADGAPEPDVEARVLPLHGEDRAGIGDRRLDLRAVPHDARVPEELADPARPEAGDARGLEAVEGPAVRLTFLENRRPAEPRLGGLEDEELEEAQVVVDRHPPLLVVVAEHRRVAVRPRAPSPHADLVDRSVAERALQIRESVSRRRTWRRGRGRRRRGSARPS